MTGFTYGKISKGSITSATINPHTIVLGRVGVGKTIVSVTLPEEERLMFLDWILFSCSEDVGNISLLPTSLLWEMYAEVAPGGKDWDTFTHLVQFIREAERNKAKAQRVLDLAMDYRGSSEHLLSNPESPFNKAVTSQYPPFNTLKGKLLKVFKGSSLDVNLTATVWHIAKQLMIVRDPLTKAALIKRIVEL